MSDSMYDIAIVGAGPAGLSAALTGRIRNKKVLLFEHMKFSDKLQKAHSVNNYLGLPAVTGAELMRQFADHALSFGPDLIKEKVVNIFPGEGMFTLLTPNAPYEAKAVIIATGVVPTGLFQGERELLGQGVSYCATCDGMLYRDREVAVISYTQEGEHEAEFLAEICSKVHYLPQYKTALAPRSNLLINTLRPRALRTDNNLISLETNKETISVEGVFILRQSDPVENLLPGIEMEGEVIKTNRDMSTSIPGVYAAGDCTGKPWQISRATGEGLVAVLSAISYLDSQAKAGGV